MNQLTRANYLKLLLRDNEAAIEISGLFNNQLTELYVNGKAEFTLEMVKKFVSYLFTGSEKQIAVLNFMLDQLLAAEQKQDYKPTFPTGFDKWAIDKDGEAYFYSCTVRRGPTVWIPTNLLNAQQDHNFDKNLYKHMWENEQWKNSLTYQTVTKTYVPSFPNSDYPKWAIDEDGQAYYMNGAVSLGSGTWQAYDYEIDYDFNSAQYVHMWENGKWRTSLRERQ